MYHMLSPETIPSPPPVCGATVVRKPTLKSTSNEDNGHPNGRITPPICGATQDTTSEPNHAASMANTKSPPPKPQFNNHQVQLSTQSAPQDKISHSNDYTHHLHSPARGVAAVGGASNGCGGGDGLLQWGQRRRTRCTRPAEKMPSSAAMAPPAPARSGAMNGRSRVRMTQNGGFNGKVASGFLPTRNRNLDDPATAASPSRNGSRRDMGTTSTSRSAAGGKRSQPLMEKQDRRVTCYYGLDRKEKSADLNHVVEENGGGGAQNTSVGGGGGGVGGGGGWAVEWPRIYISLSRKEKEDDFYAMKGTKLPHRPKKRSKAIDRALQINFDLYTCFVFCGAVLFSRDVVIGFDEGKI
ncbi:hypothetical protein AKJ16_DCAP16979 [Drosera capensis]